MLIETFPSCLSFKSTCSPILPLHRSMFLLLFFCCCCHLVLENFVFFPFACLFVGVFSTLCLFVTFYLFLDGLSHEKQLINAYAKSNSHSPFFWDKTADILYLYVCMQCLHKSTGQVSNNIVIMLIWKKTAHRINLQIWTHFKTEKKSNELFMYLNYIICPLQVKLIHCLTWIVQSEILIRCKK